MIPYFEVIKFQIGPIVIQAWGTFVALGFLACIYFVYRDIKKRGKDPNQILDLSSWIIIGSFLGARIFYVLENFGYFLNNSLDTLKIWDGGLTIYGGFLGALVAFFIFIRKKRIDFWELAEPIIFYLPLGIFIGRIGCFLIHDHIGKVTTMPWGMNYIDGTVRHEPALYEMISMLLLFIFFLLLKKSSWAGKKGFFTIIFMLWYSLSRLIFDFFRVFENRYLGLTVAQYISILVFGIGIYLFNHYLIRKRYEENN